MEGGICTAQWHGVAEKKLVDHSRDRDVDLGPRVSRAFLLACERTDIRTAR
jgi:hypothetical protein